jgi:hypothetical protein
MYVTRNYGNGTNKNFLLQKELIDNYISYKSYLLICSISERAKAIRTIILYYLYSSIYSLRSHTGHLMSKLLICFILQYYCGAQVKRTLSPDS